MLRTPLSSWNNNFKGFSPLALCAAVAVLALACLAAKRSLRVYRRCSMINDTRSKAPAMMPSTSGRQGILLSLDHDVRLGRPLTVELDFD